MVVKKIHARLFLLLAAGSALFAAPSRAQSIPTLIELTDLQNRPGTTSAFYESLERRFLNGDFSEVLFTDRPKIAGPRFDRKLLDSMILSVGQIVASQDISAQSLRVTPEIAPFRISPQSSSAITAGTLESWTGIGDTLTSLLEPFRNLTYLSGLKDDARARVLAKLPPEIRIDDAGQVKALAQALSAEYARTRDAAVLDSIRRLLAAHALGTFRASRLAGWKLEPWQQYQVLEDVLSKAAQLGGEWQVPGKAVEGLWQLPELSAVAKSDFFRKGVTVVPMTRFEAVFRSLGPGECVRCSFNRYGDALTRYAFHLKVIKNGAEIGYVSVYRTVASNGVPVWLLETIQAPLAGRMPGQSPVRSLLRHLQEVAALSGAVLALPAGQWNSFNFKDTTAELLRMPEVAAAEKMPVEIQYPADLEIFNRHIKTDAMARDRATAENSGYRQNARTNGLSFNEGKVWVLAPFHDLPDAALTKFHGLFNPGASYSAPLSLLDRITILASRPQSAEFKRWALAQAADSDPRTLAAIQALLYKETPKKHWNDGFEGHYAYVEHQINNVQMSAARAQRLKDELYPKVRDWRDYSRIIRLGDKKTEHFSPFILSNLHRNFAGATELEATQVFDANFGYIQVSEGDITLSEDVFRQIRSAEAFVRVVGMFKKNSSGGSFRDSRIRDGVITNNWERFITPETPWSAVYALARDHVLPDLSHDSDLKVFAALIRRAETTGQLQEILLLDSERSKKSWTTLDYEEVSRHFIRRLKTLLEQNAYLLGSSSFHLLLSKLRLNQAQLDDFWSVFKTKLERLGAEKFLADDTLSSLLENFPLDYIIGPSAPETLKQFARDLIRRDLTTPFALTSRYRSTELLHWVAAEVLQKLLEARHKVANRAAYEARLIDIIAKVHHRMDLAAEVPEYATLIDSLREWAGELEKSGQTAAAHKIGAKFRIRTAAKKSSGCELIFNPKAS